jgi:ribosomal protein S18 acetylase RimI-like enzyme
MVSSCPFLSCLISAQVCLLFFLLTGSPHDFGCWAFAPPSLGLGGLLFPVRGKEIFPISQSKNQRVDIPDVSYFFVESFWKNKVGGGTRELTQSQRRQLEQSQTAEFQKRYGSKSYTRQAELLICRRRLPKPRPPKKSATAAATTQLNFNQNNSDNPNEILGCVGVEVERIPNGSLLSYAEPYRRAAPLMSNLAVSRSYRRRGLAEELVQAVETLVRKQWGYTECYLYVEERNRPAIRLYQKLGYRKLWRDDTAKTLLPTPGGSLESASTVIVCMKKDLNANFFQTLFR